MYEITTFVFFDIETTGLPWQERNQTKITELSMVAASRQDIQAARFGDLPPVSKLTMVFNPTRMIHPKSAELTGLTNDLLQHAPIFKQKVKSISYFLADLPKPVCLVAHNGNTFDYKILLAECKDAGSTGPPVDLLCADSLVGFRKILKGTNINYNVLSKPVQEPTSSSDDLITDDEDDYPDFDISSEDWQEIDELCSSLSDISCEDFEERDNEYKIKQDNIRKTVVDKLFSKDQPKKKVKMAKESYTLSALYKRLLDKEESSAHRAEVDCLMLLQCVVAIKDDFLPWADKSCTLLTEIKPLVRYL